MLLQMRDGAANGIRIVGNHRKAVFATLGLDAACIDVDGKQEGSEFVVQVARNIGAFLVLNLGELVVQARILTFPRPAGARSWH